MRYNSLMNFNPTAIRILCYGDSNTWGRNPVSSGVRYPADVRWTGQLQRKLGESYEVIEEGLSARTTDLDDDQRPDRNGATYLRPCLETHNPIDIVLLALGTNDLKARFNRTPQQVAASVQGLIRRIREFAVNSDGQPPVVVLLSPPLIDETVPGVTDKYLGAGQKSQALGALLQQVAEVEKCHFLDLAKIAQPSLIDGYHLDSVSHKLIAEKLANMLESI